jgi:glycosyltransferase involved in cell wall biosynthesis
MPRVSAVLIFLNAEAFIAEAIDSVLAQSFDDWELVLVDDGSTDGSSAIAQGYAASHPERIRYLDHPGHENRGMSASRNRGASETSGEYLAFIDADDVWERDKLMEQVALLDAHPDVAMVCGALNYWYSWQPGHTTEDHIILAGGLADVTLEPPRALLHLYPLGTTAAAGVDLLIRRDVFRAVGGFEERFRGLYEDQGFLCKVFLQHTVHLSGRAWLKYRQHPQSCVATTSSSRRKYLQYRRRFLRWFADYAFARNAPGQVLNRIQRMRLVVAREIVRERLAALRTRLGFSPGD